MEKNCLQPFSRETVRYREAIAKIYYYNQFPGKTVDYWEAMQKKKTFRYGNFQQKTGISRNFQGKDS